MAKPTGFTNSELQAQYNRGYYRGSQRNREVVKVVTRIAKSWRAKALRQWTARCETCAYWDRHDKTKVGTCRQETHIADLEIARAWPATTSALGARMLSHEGFGCVNWREAR